MIDTQSGLEILGENIDICDVVEENIKLQQIKISLLEETMQKYRNDLRSYISKNVADSFGLPNKSTISYVIGKRFLTAKLKLILLIYRNGTTLERSTKRSKRYCSG